MIINTEQLDLLTTAEKIDLIGTLWDQLENTTEPLPIPAWVQAEALRRRNEMQNAEVGLSHEAIWERINANHGT